MRQVSKIDTDRSQTLGLPSKKLLVVLQCCESSLTH